MRTGSCSSAAETHKERRRPRRNFGGRGVFLVVSHSSQIPVTYAYTITVRTFTRPELPPQVSHLTDAVCLRPWTPLRRLFPRGADDHGVWEGTFCSRTQNHNTTDTTERIVFRQLPCPRDARKCARRHEACPHRSNWQRTMDGTCSKTVDERRQDEAMDLLCPQSTGNVA